MNTYKKIEYMSKRMNLFMICAFYVTLGNVKNDYHEFVSDFASFSSSEIFNSQKIFRLYQLYAMHNFE